MGETCDVVQHSDRPLATGSRWNGAAPTSNAIDETNCIAGFLIVVDIIDII